MKQQQHYYQESWEEATTKIPSVLWLGVVECFLKKQPPRRAARPAAGLSDSSSSCREQPRLEKGKSMRGMRR